MVWILSATSVQAKEVEYNAKEQGVTGNGSTNDIRAINRLLEKAKYLPDGDTLVVHFPEGRYLIDDWIRIYSNTTLILDENAEIYRTNTMYPIMMNVGSDGTRKETSSAGGGYNLSENIRIVGGIFNGGDV